MGISRVGRTVVAVALLTAACGTVPPRAAADPAPPPTSSSPSAPSPSIPSPSPSPSESGPSPSAPAPSSAAGLSTVRVVGLGDSVTSGEHCDCDDYVTGFAALLAHRTGTRVAATDDGESGSTSDGLADELAGHHADERRVQSDVARADVVVLTMGANDLVPALTAWRGGGCAASCYDPEVAQMRTDLGRVLDRVRTLGGGSGRVLVTTYWNVFTDGRVARDAERPGYLAWSDTVTRSANAAIRQVADAHGATLVDLYPPFKGDGGGDPTRLLASDGDHPDAAGTAAISAAVLAAYEASR